MTEPLVHLQIPAVSVVIDVGGGVPAVLHWGGPLGVGEVPHELFTRPIPRGGLDVAAPLSIVPEHGSAPAWHPLRCRRQSNWARKVVPSS